jgi:hypothetical protein
MTNQLHRHRGESRENFVQSSCYGSKVIDDNDRNAQIRRQMPQQPDVRVETTG